MFLLKKNIILHSVVFLLFLLIYIHLPVNGQTKSVKPVTIDASDFPSLQAAFDAIPVSGAIVLIPPGDYEIISPLILVTDNTRIQGSGAVTHIIN
ncbi:MAG: hypothetical protein JXB24_09505, partial [Bacteroidales bacterium]|nr:hypothetical protein [Bacteroidales bacterium]